MKIERRTFLVRTLGFAASSLTVKFGLPLRIGRSLVAAPAMAAPAITAAPVAAPIAAMAISASVQAQVFEVIVRQGMAGAPWRTICDGPMQVNSISQAAVEAEIIRRLNLLGRSPAEIEGILAKASWVPDLDET